MNIDFESKISQGFKWFNEPNYIVNNESITIYTTPNTDFWQRTHYGFRNDNGHCLLTKANKDFLLSVKTNYFSNVQYDQCGLIARVDNENWIKASTEYEDKNHSRLGSVVTNQGYSDWATIDMEEEIQEMWYRIQSKNNLKDYLIEYSMNGTDWKQMRISHLLMDIDEIDIGIYACSPKESSFEARFSEFVIDETKWQ